jgi:hypothetical protein
MTTIQDLRQDPCVLAFIEGEETWTVTPEERLWSTTRVRFVNSLFEQTESIVWCVQQQDEKSGEESADEDNLGMIAIWPDQSQTAFQLRLRDGTFVRFHGSVYMGGTWEFGDEEVPYDDYFRY